MKRLTLCWCCVGVVLVLCSLATACAPAFAGEESLALLEAQHSAIQWEVTARQQATQSAQWQAEAHRLAGLEAAERLKKITAQVKQAESLNPGK